MFTVLPFSKSDEAFFHFSFFIISIFRTNWRILGKYCTFFLVWTQIVKKHSFIRPPLLASQLITNNAIKISVYYLYLKSSTWFGLSVNIFFFFKARGGKSRGSSLDDFRKSILSYSSSSGFSQCSTDWVLLTNFLTGEGFGKKKKKRGLGLRGIWLSSRQAAGCAWGRPCLTWKKNLLPYTSVLELC